MKTYNLFAVDLKAAALCAKRKGHREEFQHLLIDETHIIGTSGNILFAVPHGVTNVTPFLIPPTLVSVLTKLSITAKTKYRRLTISSSGGQVVIDDANCTYSGSVKVLPDRFPRWKRVIPQSNSVAATRVGFDPALLSLAVKVSKLYNPVIPVELTFHGDLIKIHRAGLPPDSHLLIGVYRS